MTKVKGIFAFKNCVVLFYFTIFSFALLVSFRCATRKRKGTHKIVCELRECFFVRAAKREINAQQVSEGDRERAGEKESVCLCVYAGGR